MAGFQTYQQESEMAPQFFQMSGQGPAPVPGHNMPVLDVAAAEQFMDSCQQQGLQIPAAIRSALQATVDTSKDVQERQAMTQLQAAKNSLQQHIQHYEKVRQSKVALDNQWSTFVTAFVNHFEAEKKNTTTLQTTKSSSKPISR